jgi:hypothetical protein
MGRAPCTVNWLRTSNEGIGLLILSATLHTANQATV